MGFTKNLKFQKGDVVTGTSWVAPHRGDQKFVGKVISYTPYSGYGILVDHTRSEGTFPDRIGPLEARKMELVRATGTTVEEMTDRLAKLEAEVAAAEKSRDEAKARLDFMQLHGVTEFDEVEYKSFQVLQIISQQGLTEISKARLIAEIVRGQPE